jgi:4-hydroxybenzoate polyprenyltransferase
MISETTFRKDWLLHWLGWSVITVFICWLAFPTWVSSYAMGCILGGVYLAWLITTPLAKGAGHPLVFSSGRVAILGFLIVWAGHFQALSVMVVLLGFLSYKMSVLVDLVRVGLFPQEK